MLIPYEALQAERTRIADAEEKALGFITDQQTAMGDAVRIAGELRETFRDVGVEISTGKDETDELRREVALLNRQDATPKFDMTPAFKDVSRFQQELNKLRVPDLNVTITRTIR
jgi:hypothetical protein